MVLFIFFLVLYSFVGGGALIAASIDNKFPYYDKYRCIGWERTIMFAIICGPLAWVAILLFAPFSWAWGKLLEDK